MSKFQKGLASIVLVLVLFSSAAFAAGNVSIKVVNAGQTANDWQSTAVTVAAGVNWDIYVDTISNHGVGRVFKTPSYDWGSGLLTYGPSTTGQRPIKVYDGAVHGDTIVWRMRQDTDYIGLFSCSGTFHP